ncbi:MAG: hypothetical protein JW839_20470 [Candidatus Lokiarchaeota archaeon]|nr:hypothetical protein [Candidatus Lokiarchaeota archaeon]
MGLNGFIVMDAGGAPIYCNVHYTKLAVDPALITGFLSAVQSFSKQLMDDAGSGISEMTMHNMKILYRNLDNYNFIGLVEANDSLKSVEPIMEHLICIFLAKYRKYLHGGQIIEMSALSGFNLFFEKWRLAKEKDLQKFIENSSPTVLQGTLNKLVNFFPSTDLIKISPSLLKGIGKKLIWVDSRIEQGEEDRILSELKQKTEIIYGPGTFESLERDVKKNVETDSLLQP